MGIISYPEFTQTEVQDGLMRVQKTKSPVVVKNYGRFVVGVDGFEPPTLCL